MSIPIPKAQRDKILKDSGYLDEKGDVSKRVLDERSREEKILQIQEEDIIRHNLVIPSRMSGMDSFLLGVGEGANDVVEGVKEVGYNLTGNQEALDQMNRDAAGRAEYMNQSQHQGARFVGNLAGAAGMTAPLNLIPGLGVVSGVQKVARAGTGAERVAAMAELGALSPAKQGIIEGGLAPTRGQDNRIENMVIGGVMGKGGEYAVKGGVKAYTALKNRSKSLDDLRNDASLLPGERREMDKLEELTAAADRTGTEVPTSTYLDPAGKMRGFVEKTEQTPIIGNPGIRERTTRKMSGTETMQEDLNPITNKAMQNIADDPNIPEEIRSKARAKLNNPKPRDLYENIADLYNAAKWKAGAYLANGFRSLYAKANKSMGFSEIPTREEVLKFNAKLINGETQQTQVFNQRRASLKAEQLDEYDRLGGQLVQDGLPLDQAKKAVPKLTPTTTPPKKSLILDEKGNPFLTEMDAPVRKTTKKIQDTEERNAITFSRLWEAEHALDGNSSPVANMLREDIQKAQQEMLSSVEGGAKELQELKQYYIAHKAPYSNKNISNFIEQKTIESFEKTGMVDSKSLEKIYSKLPKEAKDQIVNSVIDKASKAARGSDGIVEPEALKGQLKRYRKLIEPMGKEATRAYDDMLLVLDAMPKKDKSGKSGWLTGAALAIPPLTGLFFGHGLSALSVAGVVAGSIAYLARLGSTAKGRQTLLRMRYAARNPKTIANQKILLDIMNNMSHGLSSQMQQDEWRKSQ